MQLTIDIAPGDLEVLADTLDHAISELDLQAARADAMDYRAVLHDRRRALELVRNQLLANRPEIPLATY